MQDTKLALDKVFNLILEGNLTKKDNVSMIECVASDRIYYDRFYFDYAEQFNYIKKCLDLLGIDYEYESDESKPGYVARGKDDYVKLKITFYVTLNERTKIEEFMAKQNAKSKKKK